jgi:oligopeptidase B
MKSLLIAIALFCTIQACQSPSDKVMADTIAPVAKKLADTFYEHGNTRIDYFNWLSNSADSSVINHLKKENTFTDFTLAHTQATQQKIYEELVGRLDPTESSLPTKTNGYWYYYRYEEGKQYPVLCRKKGSINATEEIVLDLNKAAGALPLYILTGYKISRDNKWLAYSADTTGARHSTGKLLNLETGTPAVETLNNISGSFAWANDHSTLYYVTNDHRVRPYKVWKHIIGNSTSADQLVYTETDSTFDVTLNTSTDNRYIFIVSGSTTTTEARFIDASALSAKPVLIQPRTKNILYYPDYVEGTNFHIRNNHNAKNFKLSVAPIANPGLGSWKDYIPHRDSALLSEVEIFRDYIVAEYVEKGLTVITVTNRRDNTTYNIDFAEKAFVASLERGTDEFAVDSIRFTYTSLTTPPSDYAYHLGSKTKTLLKQEKVGGGYNASLYETDRLWCIAEDGTAIPVTVVYKKSLFRKDGTNPMLLYAYGSYGWSSFPEFSAAEISLLDRGFVYGIAHVRGGEEMGRYWYEDGKLLKKKNTFTDFINCASFLVKEKYTSTDKLFANGGSAGGMLMGAIINMRPDLFKGVIAEVPWMDVITDMFNTDLPLTTLEYDEWGDPNKKDYYDYMLSWSPYDNIKPAAYPAILATGGLNDTQVPYFSPAKWVQKIRENNRGNAPVLFKCNMGEGHGGASGRFESQKLTALKYAFMLDQLGLITKN